MFKQNTVFILGAGASWHYGYPTGEDLVSLVKKKAKDVIGKYKQPYGPDGIPCFHHPMFHPSHYKTASGEPNVLVDKFIEQIELARDAVEQANPLVIDDFLGRNKDIAECQHVKFTNFSNHNKVSRQVARVFHIAKSLHDESTDLLFGDKYRQSSLVPGRDYSCEKSIKSVHDALAQDFDWPE
jgi:hypothetical protein